jgi:hypothetical protein
MSTPSEGLGDTVKTGRHILQEEGRDRKVEPEQVLEDRCIILQPYHQASILISYLLKAIVPVK